jgi:hypothetical protein
MDKKEVCSMSDDMNPYQSPQSPVNPEPESAARLTATMVRYLKEAAPWLRFIGILSFVGCGFMVLVGILFLLAALIRPDFTGELGWVSGGIGSIAYIGSGVLMFFPARFTYTFGAKIRGYLHSNAEEDLEQAFKNNKALWKFNGVLYIIALALVPVGIVGVVIAVIGTSLL